MAKDRTEYMREYHKRTYVPTGNKIGRPNELLRTKEELINSLKDETDNNK